MCESCEQIQEQLVPYFAGELTQADIQKLMLHLADCAACRKEAVLTLRLIHAVEAMSAALPEEVLLAAFDQLPCQADSAFHAALDGWIRKLIVNPASSWNVYSLSSCFAAMMR